MNRTKLTYQKWLLTLFAFFCVITSIGQVVTVRNMVPNAQSGETAQDSEPNITINPANPQQLVGSAFTPPPGGGANAPIYISTDGGLTWTLNNIVPGANASTGTGDITVRFGLNSNVLYAGTLRGNAGLTMNILSSNNFTGVNPMALLLTRANEDQPYIQATTVLGGAGRGNDRIYVGHNNLGAAGGRTASVEQSLDASIAAPVLTSQVIETRATFGQDSPPVRTAIHPNGTIYAMFYRATAFAGGIITCDVVVVRDDNWGTGATPYTNLTDPSDALAGRLVVQNIAVPFSNANQPNFGQERFVASNISIAVDPINSQRVYIAWADRPTGTTNYNLHVRQSVDGGNTWSATDLRTITNATNPALAINMRGEVGFLYQQLTGVGVNQRWTTQVDITANNFTNINTITLANVPTTTPLTLTQCNGDYVHLMAFGKNFIGIFSGDNTPNNANFPNGVTFARNANFATNTLLALDGVTPVNRSIDPYFFSIEMQEDEDDFYVRDWTNSAADHGVGQEPSIDPSFYTRSDVWNRRSDAAGGFNGNDQPNSENPQSTGLGMNYAFCRVHRKAAGPAKNVNLHFLKSEFGTGSNYQNAGTDPDPSLAFGAADLSNTMVAGYEWPLVATTSTHVCLAVEIDATDDPLLAPSLLGNAPGWPNTDLMVINDNNKAQRNLGVFTASGSGTVTYSGVVHNADVKTRNITLGLDIPERTLAVIKRPEIQVVGGKNKLSLENNKIILSEMLPGENRWVTFTVNVNQGMSVGTSLPISFDEFENGEVVNGFTISPVVVQLEEAGKENLMYQAAIYYRAGLMYKLTKALDKTKLIAEIIKGNAFDFDRYMSLMKEDLALNDKILATLLAESGGKDPFKLTEALQRMKDAFGTGNKDLAVCAHANYLHGIDAFMTMLSKEKGDEADILQNQRWLVSLFTTHKRLSQLVAAKGLVKAGTRFIDLYSARKLENKDFPEYVKTIYPLLEQVAKELDGQVDLSADLREIQLAAESPQRLQKAQWNYLLKLHQL